MGEQWFGVREEPLLQANDSREFVLVVQLVKRRELEDVKRLMAPPESVAAALQRVKKQVSRPVCSPRQQVATGLGSSPELSRAQLRMTHAERGVGMLAVEILGLQLTHRAS